MNFRNVQLKLAGSRLIIITICVIYLFPITAEAYLDPGTGSILLQSAIAAIAAGLFTLKLYWRQFTEFLRKLKKRLQNTAQKSERMPGPKDPRDTSAQNTPDDGS